MSEVGQHPPGFDSTPSALFGHVQTIVDPTALLRGLDAGWQAPIGVFASPLGFGEAAWVDGVDVTCIAYRISGAAVTSRTPRCAGRTSGARSNVGFQPRGTTNASTCEGSVLFAHIYVPDDLIDRVGDELGQTGISGRLRDDLWFVEDPVLDDLVCQYVERSRAQAAPASRLEMEARSILVLDRIVSHHHLQQSRLHQEMGGLAPWAERRCLEYVHARFAEDISLTDLASITGLSPFHFSRMFKHSVGLPPATYQRRVRCAKAKELLRLSTLSIGEIAAAVGYETPQAFARMFRAETGASPSEWRREVR